MSAFPTTDLSLNLEILFWTETHNITEIFLNMIEVHTYTHKYVYGGVHSNSEFCWRYKHAYPETSGIVSGILLKD